MGSNRMKNSNFYDMFEYRTEKRKKKRVKPKPDSYFWLLVASGYLKKLPLNSPRDFLSFFCSFCHPVANLGFAGFWKIQGILKKKIFGGLWLNGTMQTDLLYKTMLVTPYQAGIHLKACSITEIDV